MYKKKEDGRIQTLPYEKYETMGAEVLTDEELLAIILRTGSAGEDALSLSCKVLERCGKNSGLLGLHHISIEELQQIRGIGSVKAIKLKAIAELSGRMAEARIRKDICLRAPEEVARAYMERMRHLEREICIAVFLDGGDCRIKDRVETKGSVTGTLISPQQILRDALLCNAASLIILHNHPSGNPAPSGEDVAATKKLLQAAALMEIPLLDHIIIGDGSFYSFRKEGVI